MLGSFVRRTVGGLPAPILRWLGRIQFKVPAVRRLGARVAGQFLAQDMTIAHGPAKGMLINVAGAHPGYGLGTSEPVLQQALVQHLAPGAVFYDLGANVGFFTLLAARLVGATGRVVSFEPDPRNANALRRNVALNALENVEVVEQGVSDRTGAVRFTLGPSTGSHFARAEDSGENIDVRVTTLDAVLANGYPPPTLLKMDIEGEEVRALEGAAVLLAQHRPTVICEVHHTEAEVRALLAAAGYRMRLLEGRSKKTWNVHILAAPGVAGAMASL
jgi:FkbM family methyltransferase